MGLLLKASLRLYDGHKKFSNQIPDLVLWVVRTGLFQYLHLAEYKEVFESWAFTNDLLLFTLFKTSINPQDI